ncbi:SUKH-4 family immunity protein [Streptomyces sp. NBC_01232]|uniref:SUKH-4 family immunity protein n=1 Tax=Streptomyces sp. NBC_01232 TaxID=2903786 RepID=UPI002E13101D|nr:SUKH-4 family immunity protein [Streptomyces sp. NBC_01232]
MAQGPGDRPPADGPGPAHPARPGGAEQLRVAPATAAALRAGAGSIGSGSQPTEGAVYFVAPDGEARFANSGVGLWLDVLHRYGSRVTASELLGEPDGPEEYLSEEEEEQAFAELDRLAEELKEIDPAAFDGYADLLWPQLLDRWLY